MQKTKIEWADYVWNPITGCYHGCEYCYAIARSRRFNGGDFTPAFHPEKLAEVQRAKSGIVFAGSNGDMFGSWVNDRWISGALAVAAAARATTMFLTKNPARYHKFLSSPWGTKWVDAYVNMWFGTTLDWGYGSTGWNDVEQGETVHHDTPSVSERIHALETLDYPRKWVSIEPLHPAHVEGYDGLDVGWVVLGVKTPLRKFLGIDDLNNIRWLAETYIKRGIPVFVKNSIAQQAPDLCFPRMFPPGVKLATKTAALTTGE